MWAIEVFLFRALGLEGVVSATALYTLSVAYQKAYLYLHSHGMSLNCLALQIAAVEEENVHLHRFDSVARA